MTRVAAVDCGTNSIRLLIADVHTGTDNGTATLSDVVRRMEIVRLGHGVDRTGRIDDAAMERTLAACRSFADDCRTHEVTQVRFVATSASRDASNAGEFVAGVRSAFAGIEVAPEVVDGLVEAQLSFAGATAGLVAAQIPGPYLVVDLGGGSTELVRGRAPDQLQAAASLDVGSVRMTERYLHDDPPTEAQIAAARADVDAQVLHALARIGAADAGGVGTLVGLAGSITTVTAHALRLPSYQSSRTHLARMSPERTVTAALELVAMPRPQRAELPYLHPGRVDVIAAGALVWARIVLAAREHGLREVVTSEHDILDGIALGIVAR